MLSESQYRQVIRSTTEPLLKTVYGVPLQLAVPPARLTLLSVHLGLAVCLFLLPLRVLNAQHARFNSDEPQHMHIVWGWTRGMIQYRDTVDNHSPLFHLLWAPILCILPTDSSTLPLLRLTMLPIYAATLWLTYLIVRRLLDRRWAFWATAVLAVWPSFFKMTGQFRTDQLFMLTWIAALAVYAGGVRRFGRATLLGLILGAGFATSMKTTVLLVCLIGAQPIASLLIGRVRKGSLLRWIQLPAGVFTGALVVPAAILTWFGHLGALGDLYRGVIAHNTGSDIHRRLGLPISILIFLAIVAIGFVLSRHFLAGRLLRVRARRAFTLCWATLLSIAAFKTLWPIFEPQDWLPLTPMLVISIAILVHALIASRPSLLQLPRVGFLFQEPHRLALILLVGSAAVNLVTAPYSDKATAKYLESIRDVCQITTPEESVVDAKGDFVFRPRALPYVCETLTRAQMKAHPGLDRGPEFIVASGAMVSMKSIDRFPAGTRRFIQGNFLPAGTLAFAGKFLTLHDPRWGSLHFNVALPGDYDFLTRLGSAGGMIDGEPILGPVHLAAGAHIYQYPPGASSEVAILWHRATEKGYSIHWGKGL